jgi:hypothetical protein
MGPTPFFCQQDTHEFFVLQAIIAMFSLGRFHRDLSK